MATPSSSSTASRERDGDGAEPSDVPVEALRACYEAFAARRLRRGARSVRTRQGFERLRDAYQPRLRFLQEAPSDGTAEANACDARVLQAEQSSGDAPTADAVPNAVAAASPQYSDEEDDAVAVWTSAAPPSDIVDVVNKQEGPPSTSSEDSEASALTQLVGVFFDARVRRLLLETVWPMAHHGGSTGDELHETISSAKLRVVPEWQELEEFKYFAFMFKALVWLFPGLPAFEAQSAAEYDWKKDCEFDSYGSFGLSFEGFMVSMLDLAVACTDSSTEKCIEFLKHLTKRLESSLPIFRVPTTSILPSLTNEDEASETPKSKPFEPIVWRTIPLERLFPCPVRARPQFLELKAKLSTAPVVLMVLAGNERPIELQLSTSAKLLVRERDHRSSIRRNTMQSNALSHFIEIEKQFLWTFRSFPARPTLVIVPSGLVSKRTLSLYACCRLLESHEHSLDQEANSDSDPVLTLFTAVQEPFPLLIGSSNSLCGRVDRQSSRVFVVDRRDRDSTPFKIIFKTSLIHNTSSAGGAGTAAIIASLAHVTSAGTARCKSELIGGSTSSSQNTPHSFIFVVKVTSDLLANGPQRRRASVLGAGKGSSKCSEASVPAQWFTTLCGANENKTIYIDGALDSEDSTGGDRTELNTYYIYVFTLHGFYFEAMCEENSDEAGVQPAEEVDDSPLSVLTHAEARGARSSVQAPPGSVMYAQDDDEMEIAAHIEQQEHSVLDPTTKSSAHNMTTSTALLRQLLHLRKQRQLRATSQPPPEFVGGSKITNVRTLTSAAGLRAKFLKARAEERRARFLQNEEEFRSKVVSRLLKADTKKRALRGEVDLHQTPETSTAPPTSTALSPDLEAKAALMVNFFKEMALYQPTQRELDEADKNPLEQEEELLENFADLFHDDHALHNMLDEEKWMSAAEKSTRRRSLLNEGMKTRRLSLVVMNKQQVPQLDDDDVGVSESRDAAQKKSTTTRASEDYYSTAMLINQLMSEVADEQTEQAKFDAQDTKEVQKAKELEMLRQLTVSWGYAAHGTAPSTSPCGSATGSPSGAENQDDEPNTELQQLEAVRRDHWLSSHHIAETANNERLQQYHATLRPILVPTRQHFDQQEEQLPWQPVWEIETSAEAMQQNLHTKSPKQITRPKTASSVVFVPRPPEPSIGTDRSPAVKAATIPRHHTRRIRSAHAKSVVQPTVQLTTSSSDTHRSLSQQTGQYQRELVTHVPEVFLRRTHVTSADEEECVEELACVANVNPATADDSQSVEDTRSESSEIVSQDLLKADMAVSLPSETNDPKRKPKRKKAKKLSKEDKRFSGRLRELLSISPLLQSFTHPDSR